MPASAPCPLSGCGVYLEACFDRRIVAEIKAAGGEAVANYASVATMEGAASIVDSAVQAFGRLDVLVDNAGIVRDKTILKMTEEMWDSVIAVHLKGTFCCTFAAATRMKEQETGGSIINTTSFAGLKGNFGQTNYAAARAGIYGMTLVNALELRKIGVRVNALAPLAKTRMTTSVSELRRLISELGKDPAGSLAGELGKRGTGISPDAAGTWFHGDPAIVKAREILDFAEATNDPNPWFVDETREGGTVAPPLFAVRHFNLIYGKALTDPHLKADLGRLLFGEMELRLVRPIRAGDLVATKAWVMDLESKDSGQVMRLAARLMIEGEIAVDSIATFFVRWPKTRIQPLKKKPVRYLRPRRSPSNTLSCIATTRRSSSPRRRTTPTPFTWTTTSQRRQDSRGGSSTGSAAWRSAAARSCRRCARATPTAWRA